MIKVKYPRRGFVVEEVIQGCCCETAEKFVVIPWEDYGEDNFNNMTEDVTIGEYGSDGSADDYTEGECPECEESVVYKHYFVVTSDANAIKTAEEAVDYAVDVLNASFPEGESLIATDAESSYSYADCVLKAPFPLGEAAIATNAQYSYEYSRDVLHAPFPLGEAVIATNAHIFKMYKELFPEPQATPEPQPQAPATPQPQAQATPEPQAPDSINIVSGFYLKEKPSMSDKQKRKQKIKDVIKSTFLTLVYTLEDIIEWDRQHDTYHFIGCMVDGDNIMKRIHDLMETFPNLTENLAEETYPKVKSYMDEYSKYRKEKYEKEKKEKEKPNV